MLKDTNDWIQTEEFISALKAAFPDDSCKCNHVVSEGMTTSLHVLLNSSMFYCTSDDIYCAPKKLHKVLREKL